MFYYVSYWDLLLTPIYIYIFYNIAIWLANKFYHNDEYLRKKLIQAFWLKIISGILYIILVQFYYKGGDSFMYFGFGRIMHNAIIDDFYNIKFFSLDANPFFNYVDGITINEFEVLTGYMANIGNQIIAKLCCFFGFLCFQNYSVTSIFFAMLSYIGVWKMYIVFYNIFKAHKKIISISFLFLPSFVFWSSGILKEPVYLFTLGYIINFLFNWVLQKKISLRRFLLLIFYIIILISIKGYIFYAFIIPFLIFFFFSFIQKQKKPLKISLFILFILTIWIAAPFLTNYIMLEVTNKSSIEDLVVQTLQAKDTYESLGGSFVDIPDFEPTVIGIISKTPQALVNVFFRPYFWETKNIVMVFSMLESAFLLFIFLKVLIKNKFIFFFKRIFNSPIYTFCFLFSLILGIIVGLTTFNFGTIIRYKMACIPFLWMLLLLLNTKYNPDR